MPRGIADTSIFIARESGRPLSKESLPDEIGVSIVTIAELRAGVLVVDDLASRDRRLVTLSQALVLDPIPIDGAVAEAWATLRMLLKQSGQRMGVNDSWIGATAMAMDLPLVTQDEGYPSVEGLEVLSV